MIYIDEIDPEIRVKIGDTITDMKAGYDTLRNIMFVMDQNGDPIEERMEGASELFDIFEMWMKGNALDYIGESIFQDDGELIKKILAVVGINDNSTQDCGTH